VQKHPGEEERMQGKRQSALSTGWGEELPGTMACITRHGKGPHRYLFGFTFLIDKRRRSVLKYSRIMAKNDYIMEMQVARGIGILLVTVGHSEPVKSVFPHLFNVIYSFHMPLFFFLSGFFSMKFANISSLDEWRAVAPKRLVNLIIPYFTITACFSFFKYFVPQWAVHPVAPEHLLYAALVDPTINPAKFLWFLYSLIAMRLVTPFLTKVGWYVMLPVLVLFNLLVLDIRPLAIGLIIYYLVFYYSGILASTMQDGFLKALKKRIVTLGALIIFAGGYAVSKEFYTSALALIVAFSGIVFVLSLCFCYIDYLPRKFFETMGKYSFPIYLLQYFFIYPLYLLLDKGLSWRGEWIVPCSLVAGICGPLFLVSYIFPHSRILSLLVSGIEISPKTAEKE
jgi:fucose 4-O-acetylase-like acetyltransferase